MPGTWRTTSVRLLAPTGGTGSWLTTRAAILGGSGATGSWYTTRAALLAPRSTIGTWRTTRIALIMDTTILPPSADAGTAQTVNCAELVQLDGTRSTTINGTISSYTWRVVSSTGVAPTLSSTSSATPTFRAPVLAGAQTIVFGLIVHDSTGGISNEDVVAVSVLPAPLGVPSGSAILPAGILVPVGGVLK